MPAQCFECREYGHIAADCPAKLYAAEIGDGKPPWCMQCDRETRLVYVVRHGAEAAHRCQACHPQGHMLPVTYKKCRGCGHAIYFWDVRSECGMHQPVGKQLKTKKEMAEK
jgi:hypothetical protein